MRGSPLRMLLALGLTLPWAASTSAQEQQDAPRPNIILVLVDDMGFSDIGPYGGEIETPTLDALAAGGLRYSQFRNTARCCPTRAMLMTGLHPHQAGIGWMTLGPNQQPDPQRPPAYQGYLNEHCVTLAEVLKSAGYATFMTGKWHLGRHEPSLWPLQQGFDRFWGSVSGAFNFFAPEHPRGIHDGNAAITAADLKSTTDRRFYTTDAFTDHAIRFLDDHFQLNALEEPAPFFLYLAYNAPHWPMQAHEEDIAKYRGKYKLGWDALRRQRYARQIDLGLIDADWPLSERDGPAPAWDELDEAKQDEMDLRMAIYAAMVDRVDQNLGRLVDFLKEQEAYEDTLILFLSDNGGCAEGGVLGNHDIYDLEARNAAYDIAYGLAWANASNTPFRLYKHWSHEGGVATPFIAHWPAGIAPQADWYREPAQLIDLMPTLIELAGAAYPSEVDGQSIHPLTGVSLTPSFTGAPLQRSGPMFNEHEGHGFMQDGRWKLVGRNVARRDGYHPRGWELYDLEADRTEQHNLAGEQPERLSTMAQAWERWAHETGVFPKRKPPQGAPNVLLILADDLGYSDLGAYGGEIPTPNLDALAAEGVRFSQFTNSARCCPSRASLLTGLHPHETGVGSFATAQPRAGGGPAYTGHLSADCATLAELLGDAGYSTWMVGKWHLGTPGPIERGFQNYYGYRNFLAHSENQWDPSKYGRLPAYREPELDFGEDFYVTDAFTAYARAFLDQAREQERPWFLYLAHSSPHFPIQAPRASIDRHLATYRRGWDVLRRERLERMQRLGLIDPSLTLPPRSLVPVDREDIANGFPGQPNPAWDALTPARREDLAYRMATFAAMVEHVDQGIGRIVEDLRAHGELDNTLILFLSDNGACYEWGPFGFDGPSRRGTTTLHEGEALLQIGQDGTHQSYGSGWAILGNTPLNLYKHFAHEGGISSPLIAHWPAQLPRRTAWVTEPAHIMDLVPTVLEAAGLEYPEARRTTPLQPLSGLSLLPAMRGQSLVDAEDEVVAERALAYEHQLARALRRGKWKLVWGKRMPTEPRWELYDLEADRTEQHDLAAQHPELVQELAAEWEAWAREVGADPFPLPDPAGDPSLWIADRAIHVAALVELEEDAQGVLVAQGGRVHGFSLHLDQGVPVFEVRRDGAVQTLRAPRPVTGRALIVAELNDEHLELQIDGELVAQAASPGLLPGQPTDPREVGRDNQTAVGSYASPHAFRGGRILDTDVFCLEVLRD